MLDLFQVRAATMDRDREEYLTMAQILIDHHPQDLAEIDHYCKWNFLQHSFLWFIMRIISSKEVRIILHFLLGETSLSGISYSVSSKGYFGTNPDLIYQTFKLHIDSISAESLLQNNQPSYFASFPCIMAQCKILFCLCCSQIKG